MESTIFRPSQWINLGYIIFGIVGIPFSFGASLIIPIWKMIETHYTMYIFYEDRIIFKRGVFSVTTDEILFYRVKAINLEEPFLYRLVGLCTIKMITSDKYVNEFTMVGISVGGQGQGFRDTIREQVEEHRGQKGVREFDLYNL